MVSGLQILSVHYAVVVEVHSHVIFLSIFNKKKHHPRFQEHMASTSDPMEKDLLFSEKEGRFASVQVLAVRYISGSCVYDYLYFHL